MAVGVQRKGFYVKQNKPKLHLIIITVLFCSSDRSAWTITGRARPGRLLAFGISPIRRWCYRLWEIRTMGVWVCWSWSSVYSYTGVPTIREFSPHSSYNTRSPTFPLFSISGFPSHRRAEENSLSLSQHSSKLRRFFKQTVLTPYANQHNR